MNKREAFWASHSKTNNPRPQLGLESFKGPGRGQGKKMSDEGEGEGLEEIRKYLKK